MTPASVGWAAVVAPGAAGNLATEDLVFMAYKMGFGTGVDFNNSGRLLPGWRLRWDGR
ncbi:MAG: hypothetical protein R3C44_06375 [Chloroflexota bacterium]